MAASRAPESLEMCRTLRCEHLTRTGRCKVRGCQANRKKVAHYRLMQEKQAREEEPDEDQADTSPVAEADTDS